MYGTVPINYVRKQLDWSLATNQIITFNTSSGGFINDEVVQIFNNNTKIGQGQVTFANTSICSLQHIIGTGNNAVVGTCFLAGQQRMPALLPSRSLNRPAVPSPVQAALSASTVYAALTDGPVATVFRYVTPHGPTHDDELNPRPAGTNTTRRPLARAKPFQGKATQPSLNVEPGCLKVVDTFRISAYAERLLTSGRHGTGHCLDVGDYPLPTRSGCRPARAADRRNAIRRCNRYFSWRQQRATGGSRVAATRCSIVANPETPVQTGACVGG